MNTLRRISHIALKEFLELWRHAGIVAFVLAIPIIEVIVLGYATSGAVENLPAAIYDADRTAASRRLIDTIHEARSFEVTYFVNNMAQAEQMLDESQISAFFIIPQGFEQTLISGNGDSALAAAAVCSC